MHGLCRAGLQDTHTSYAYVYVYAYAYAHAKKYAYAYGSGDTGAAPANLRQMLIFHLSKPSSEC